MYKTFGRLTPCVCVRVLNHAIRIVSTCPRLYFGFQLVAKVTVFSLSLLYPLQPATAAETLVVLGTAASAVQVIDFGLRLSREAYTFLHEVKGSRKDIGNVSCTLRSVTSVLLGVKGYVEERRNDGSHIPESIFNGLHVLQTILIDMRSLLPNDCTDLSVYKRIRWVTDAKRLR